MIHEFFQAEQAGHFAKYMCRIDCLTTSYIGIELLRTGTIANGADKCDFRYKLARNPQAQPLARLVEQQQAGASAKGTVN